MHAVHPIMEDDISDGDAIIDKRRLDNKNTT